MPRKKITSASVAMGNVETGTAVVVQDAPITLPEHSPLGASSADRWMNCPGSVALINAVKTGETYEEEDPDYRRDGIQAHALAAWCLQQDADAWEGMSFVKSAANYPNLTEEMMSAVQVYLDFVRKLPGRDRYVELKMHRPEFHQSAFGTMDFAAIAIMANEADFVDYKHGEGIVVEVFENPQLMYYVYLFIGGDNTVEYPDDMVIRVHICQPRVVHRDGPIRTWTTTADYIRKWANEELRPAMERTIKDRYLSVGEWCRFCPAKMICPAMTSLSDEMTYNRSVSLVGLSNEQIGDFYTKWQWLKMRGKDLEAETARRVLVNGEKVPGVKAVRKRSVRAWKDGAEEAAQEIWGNVDADIYTKPEFVGPPAMEKLADGKAFVAEWAFTPDNGLTIALESDSRLAVSVSPETKYGELNGPGQDN